MRGSREAPATDSAAPASRPVSQASTSQPGPLTVTGLAAWAKNP
jgi:hypothetical protein